MKKKHSMKSNRSALAPNEVTFCDKIKSNVAHVCNVITLLYEDSKESSAGESKSYFSSALYNGRINSCR